MPAPMMTPTPNTTRSRAPRSFLSLWSGSSVSLIDCSIDFVRSRLMLMWVGVPQRLKHDAGSDSRPHAVTDCRQTQVARDGDGGDMDLQLDDRIAMVTGASQGIGLATALTLRAEGARVAAVSRSLSLELEAALDHSLVHVAADLSTADAPAAAVAAVVTRFGGLDVLVNNAGGPPPGVTMPRFSFDQLDDDDWWAMLDFNLLSTVRAVRAALPHLLEHGGSIVNVSSTHAHVPSGVNVDYGAAKAGVNNLTQALSEEFGPRGVRVNTVSPGPVRTPWWTKDGGAADVLGAGHRVGPRHRAGPVGRRDDEPDHRTPDRPPGDRRRHRPARVAAVGEHHRLRRHRGRRAAQGGLTGLS